jgi:octaprenyl-diphosphate synthase
LLLINRNTGESARGSAELWAPPKVISKTNKVIASILAGDLPILKKIAAYVVRSGGKRIRPLFGYYLGRSYGVDGVEMVRLGALLEIVHAASLLHDDVIDGAEERRSKPSGAKLFGNKQVVLGGDHLLSSGLSYLNSLNNPSYMAIFTAAIKALSSAELLQLTYLHNLKTTESIHNAVVDGKTAVLFRAAGSLVAVQLGVEKHAESAMAELGLEFGRFFQERDDYLDYFDAARLKKKGLQDFANGIVTAPLILLMRDVTRTEAACVTTLWNKAKLTGNVNDTDAILRLMVKYRVSQRISASLVVRQDRIMQLLSALPGKRAGEIIRQQFQKILAVRSA